MDLSAFLHALVATDSPSLPGVLTASVALRCMWAVVLAVLLVALLKRQSQRVQIAAAVAVVLWAFLPSSLSVAYWLGLAFMLPSWMMVALCLRWLYHHIHRSNVAVVEMQASGGMRFAQLLLAFLGVGFGWLLMADMLLWLPIMHSVYAWGFSVSAVVVATLLAVVPWLLWGVRMLPPDGGVISVLVLPVLVLIAFVFTRLPTGNLWDALLDPWLWAVLHVYLIQKLVNFVRRKPVQAV